MGWLKPYLRNVKRLSMNENQIMSPDIISAFETAALEIEILAYNPKKEPTDSCPCILVTFKYFVKPSLSYQQPESYQRGAIHVGKVEVSLRSYGWSLEEMQAYKSYRESEELELLGVIDSSIKAAMEALSEDLEKYLAEAGEEEFKKKFDAEEEKKNDKRNIFQKWLGVRTVESPEESVNILEPFVAIFAGFGEIVGSFVPAQISKKSKSPNSDASKKNAADASKRLLLLLKNYKKAHQLLTW